MTWELLKYRAMRRAEEAMNSICEHIYGEEEVDPDKRLDEYVSRRRMP